MAITYLKQPKSFGQSFAEGATGSLERLISGRLMDIEKKNERRNFSQSLQNAFPNVYSPEISDFVSQFDDPKQRISALENLSGYLQGQGYQNQSSNQQSDFEQNPTVYGAAQQQRAQELSPDQVQSQNNNQFQVPDPQQFIQNAKAAGYQITPEQEKQLQQKVAQIQSNPQLMQQYQKEYLDDLSQNKTLELRQPGSTAQAIPFDQIAQQQRPPQQSLNEQKRLPFQKPLTEQQQLQSQQAQERIENQRNAQIERTNKPYNDALDKRISAADEAYDKALQMKELLETGDVATGISGYKPLVFQGSDSQVFNGLGDDVAAALTGLQSGTQTISKIKFNKDRKANLTQDRNTQIRRVNDMLKTAEKILIEGDIRNSLIQDGKQTANMSAAVSKIYNKVKNDIPDVPENAEVGKEFVDPATGAIWTVAGNRMQFSGIAERR